jgi:hypothetical protein
MSQRSAIVDRCSGRLELLPRLTIPPPTTPGIRRHPDVRDGFGESRRRGRGRCHGSVWHQELT